MLFYFKNENKEMNIAVFIDFYSTIKMTQEKRQIN